MKRGTAFTPDGPLTLGDLRDIAYNYDGDDDYIVEIRTPMAGDRRQVTLTVTDQRWTPPPALPDSAAETGDGAPTAPIAQEN